jgi:hypothetical protein
MKKILLLTVLVFTLICSVNAQIPKGSIFLGGDIGGSVQKTKSGDVTTNKNSGIYISPVIGKAIKENLVVGLNASFGFNNNKNLPNNGKFETDYYAAGVFMRKYKNLGKSDFYLFFQAGMSVSFNTQKQEGPFAPLVKQKGFSVVVIAYPGLSYAVSKKLHLETGFNNLVSLSYVRNKAESGSPVIISKSNSLSFSSSLSNATSSLFLGIRVFI